MDQLSTNPNEQIENSQINVQPISKNKKSWLRTLACILNIFAAIVVWALAACVVVFIIMHASESGINDLFGYEGDVLGIVSFAGIIVYALLFLAIVVAIIIAISFGQLNKKYRRMAKASRKFTPALFGISSDVTGSIVLMFIALILLGGFWGLTHLLFKITAYISIIFIVSLSLQVIACTFAVVDVIIAKRQFKKLTTDEQQTLLGQADEIHKASRKIKKQKRVGKLY